MITIMDTIRIAEWLRNLAEEQSRIRDDAPSSATRRKLVAKAKFELLEGLAGKVLLGALDKRPRKRGALRLNGRRFPRVSRA